MSNEITKADEAVALNERDVKPAIGIITALPHEYVAVKVLLESQRSVFVPGRGAGRQYLYGEVPAPNGGRHSIVLALLPDTGNNLASARAALLLEHFPSVNTVIMSGIAGGVPNPDKAAEHVRLGDIVVSNREGVVQYDFGKEELEDGMVKITPRHPPRPPSASLIETARLLQAGEMEGERPWVQYVNRALERLSAARPPAETDVLASTTNTDEVVPHPLDPKRVENLPRVFVGPVASSNTLLKNPVKRDQLRDKFGVKAVEMEGSGIADAAWSVEVQYLVIRGICDYCDRNKGDDWQVYAAIVAAAYARALLEATPQNNQVTINPNPADIKPPEPSRSATNNILSTLLDSVSSDLSEEKSDKLEELRELFREGSTKDAYEGVQKLRRSQNWLTFSGRLRAAILRALATMTLSIKGKGGVAEAEALAEEARSAEPSKDDVTLRARIKVYAEGHAAALDELADPVTLDGFNLRLALLLDTGKIEEALNVLNNPPEGITYDAEAHRLFALALLASKDVSRAREQISEALTERPRRQYIRFNAAVIDYFSSLSLLALPPYLVPYPRPVPFSMVKGDAVSRERLLSAAEEFKRLAEQAELKGDELKTFEAWRLACLANLPDRQAEAIEFCKERLVADPGNARILTWVLFRGYEVDLSESVTALEHSLEEPDDDQSVSKLEELLALIGIHLKQGTHQEALALIETKRSIFSSAGADDLRRYWRGQLLIASGQAQTALDESAEIEDQFLRRFIKTASLSEIANRSGDWQPLVSHLEDCYEKEGDIDSLLALCELKSQFRDWPYVADRAELYCDAIGTAAAARFAIGATWNAKRPAKCLQLLDRYEPLFQNGKLPSDLRRLRVHCLISTSDIGGALDEAQKLTKDDPSVENTMLLMDVQLTKGDLTGLEVSARSLLHRDDLTSEQRLRAAHLVNINNPALAKKFWSQAVESAADDPNLTAFAVHMAAKLGVENQRGSLMQRMMEYAAQGQGPVKVMNMEQTLEMMKEGRQRREKLEQMYAAGETPLQLLVKEELAQIFRGLAEWNRSRPDGRHRRWILVRHGGRVLPQIDDADGTKDWRLYCDITSLLLAHELGVLEKIEEIYKPLRVSRYVTTALITERDKLKPHQQAQLDESRAVLELVSKGRLRVLNEPLSETWVDEVRCLVTDAHKEEVEIKDSNADGEEGENAQTIIPADAATLEQQLGLNRLGMLAAALVEGGFAVGFLPMQCYGIPRHTLLVLPESLSNRVINCRAIADSLRGNDRITEEAYREALRSLGVEGNAHAAVTPLIGSTLFLMEGVADILVRANLLERMCSNFDVVISSSSVKEAEDMVEHYERLAKIGVWLSELIHRISDGLDEGTYEFINIPDERIAERDDREEELGQGLKATLELFLFEPHEQDVIWIDDRALNKYPVRGDAQGGVPVIGINEILLALRGQGELDEHSYYDLLLRLREGNFRYIPLDKGEISHYLKQARIENGMIVETEALSALRRYFASCLLDKDVLQLGPNEGGTPNPHSEAPFVVQTINTVTNAIADVWAEETAVETASARADWILNNLYTGHYGCAHLRSDASAQDDNFSPGRVIALDVCNLLMRGVSMQGNPLSAEPVQRRNHYFNWLTDRIISRRYGSDPKVIKMTAEDLQGRFKYVRGQNFSSPHFDPSQTELYTRAFMGKFFLDLPDVISNEMEFDEEMTEWLRLKRGAAVIAAGLNFPLHDYWRAVEQTLATGTAAVKTFDSETEYRLVRTADSSEKDNLEDDALAISLIDPDGNQVGVMSDPIFGVLLQDVQARRAMLEKLRSWFDCKQEEFEAEADTISSIEDAVTRASRLSEWRARSTEFYYSSLEQKFRNRESVTWPELAPPSAESLAGRFRLPLSLEGSSFTDAWKESARVLLSEDNLLAVIARFSSVPVAMPEEVVAAVSALPDGERRELFERLVSAWTSPLRRLHLVNLILRSSPTDDTAVEVARKVLVSLYDEDAGIKDFNAFHNNLTFFNEEFDEWGQSNLWSAEVRLAMVWAHACRLHELFRAFGVSVLESGRHSFFREGVVRDAETWNDCSHPQRLNRTTFLTHGVAHMLAGIDPSVLEAVGLPALIRKEVFREVAEGTRFPEFSLLIDPALYKDKLHSLLGGDRHALLSQLIGPEDIEILSTENLKQLVGNHLEELVENSTRTSNWAWIHMVTNDLPIYPEFSSQCRSALEMFDPSIARKDGFKAGLLAFRAAAYKVMYLEDESLRQKYRAYVVEMLKREVASDAEEDSDSEFSSLERRIDALIEIASILSNVPNNPAASNQEFTSLLEIMSSHWSEFSSHYGHLLSKEVWHLPVEEIEGWWHLTLRIRASK